MTRIPWNVPNALGLVRLLASPALVVVAWNGLEPLFLGVFLVLEATDWIDGKLAVRLDQRTTFGSRLDTVADMVMYAGLLAGLALLEGRALLREWPWMAPALAGYAASWGLSFWKFGSLPSYHAWSAKASWLFAVTAVVGLLIFDRVWPVRLAAAVVTVANVEAIALTLKLDRPRSDVRSVFLVERDGGR